MIHQTVTNGINLACNNAKTQRASDAEVMLSEGLNFLYKKQLEW